MNLALISAVLCLVLWVVLAFIAAIPSGWVHLPLAAGTVLLAISFVHGGKRRESNDQP